MRINENSNSLIFKPILYRLLQFVRFLNFPNKVQAWLDTIQSKSGTS